MPSADKDVFSAALGPVQPDFAPWVARKFKAGASMGFGSLRLTPEAADTANKLRQACAARNMPVPKAVMLILRHYLQQQERA